MKKEFLLVIALAVVIVILLGALFFLKAPPKVNSPVTLGNTGIVITALQGSATLAQSYSSPLVIKGYVTGKDNWTGFEGQVGTVKLLDYKGNELALGILTATTEWTTLPTNFETTLNFVSANAGPATLVFKNENASGLPEKDKTFSLPINIAESKTMEVTVYFGNMALSATSEQDECKRVYPVKRIINETQGVAKAALEELLKGPTDQEKSQGYFSSIPAGSALNSITINNGQAKADFNATAESGGGSCSMASRVAQITQTLKQFPTVTAVNLSINGRTGDIFQP